MSLPRRLLPNQRYTLSRRTREGRFFLLPTAAVFALVRYVWILVASRHAEAIATYGCTYLSNHHHTHLLDLRGGADSALPAYCRDLHSLLSRSLNAQHGRIGKLWDDAPTHALEVHDDQAQLRQLVYVMAQPVAAGLVERAEDWPGQILLPDDIGAEHVAERPDHLPFFATRSPRPLSELAELRAEQTEAELRAGPLDRKRRRQLRRRQRRRERSCARRVERVAAHEEGRRLPRERESTLPKRVRYTIPIPAALAHHPTLAAVRADLWRRLRAEEARIQAERARAGLGFLGVRQVLRASITDRPSLDLPRFKRIPVVACTCREERFAHLTALVEFRHSHRKGVETLLGPHPWRAHFPPGTHLRARELARLLAARAPPRAA